MNRTGLMAFAVLVSLAMPVRAAPLDGSWSGNSAGGEAADITVDGGSVSDFTWRGKTFDTVTSKASEGGTRLEFTYPKGSGVRVLQPPHSDAGRTR